ncbi:Mitochondrial distribution and morphology protein 12 [Dispira simplex]|nr:Mitochondrial distribution and morphology protein 12 [Dispira simplex]
MDMLPAKQPSVATSNLPNKHVGRGTASTSRMVGESTSIREESRGHRSKSAAPLPIPVRTTSRNYRSLGSRHSTPPIAHPIQRTRVAGYEYPPGQPLPSKSGVASNALRGRSGTRRPPSRHSPGLDASPRHDSPGRHPSTGRKSPGYHGADTSRRSGAVSRSSIGLSEREGPHRNFQETEQRKTTKRTGKLPQLPTPSANQAGPRTYFGKDSRIRKALGRKNSKNEERLGKSRGASLTGRRVEKTAEGYEKDATGETEQSIPSFDEESATDPEQLLAALLSGDIFGLGEHFTTPAETWTGWAEHPSEEPSATEENFHRDTLVGGRKSRRRFAQPSAAHHLPGRITYITPDLNLDQDDSVGTYRPVVQMASDVPGGLPAIQPGSVGIKGETSAVSDHAIDTGLPSTKIDRIPSVYDTTTDIEEGAFTFGQSPAVATPQEPSTGGPSVFPPPEPASILKAISNYLVPALTELLLPLDYPFSPSVHILPDSAVVIRDEEPTSIIAYTLSSRDFRMQFTSVAQPNLSPQRVDLWDPYGASTSPRRNLRITTTTTTGPTPTQTTTTPMTTSMPGGLGDPKDPVYVENGKHPIDTGLSGTHSSPVPPVADQCVSPSTTTVTPTDDSKRSPQAPSHRPSRHNSAPTSPTLGSMPREHTWQDLEQTLRASTSNHVRYEFNHGPTNFVCKIFFAEQFDALRRSCECELAYIESLSRCAKWHASGGKSGSAFLKTADNRFIVKELSKPEVDSFLQFASNYFEYLAEAIFHELPTVLAKIYGLYQISFKNPVTGKSLKLDVMIMENLFYERQFTKTFDLKGSTRNRLVADTGKAGEVLLDENFLQYLTQSPLYVREHSKELIQSSIWNDTLFLANHDIVDYSLLVAIDEEKHDLVVGIVDFIQTFTWDKRLENWVKETGFLGGGGKQPTIISPKQYKQRFRNAMGRYFTVVPDKFFNTAIPLHEDDDSVDEETPGPAATSSP